MCPRRVRKIRRRPEGAQCRLEDGIGIAVATAKVRPQGSEHRRQQKDETGVEALRLRGGELHVDRKPEEIEGRRRPDLKLRVAFGELIEGGASLLEQHPEDDRSGDEDEREEKPSSLRPGALRGHEPADVAEDCDRAEGERRSDDGEEVFDRERERNVRVAALGGGLQRVDGVGDLVAHDSVPTQQSPDGENAGQAEDVDEVLEAQRPDHRCAQLFRIGRLAFAVEPRLAEHDTR